jgi:hypothetical protein
MIIQLFTESRLASQLHTNEAIHRSAQGVVGRTQYVLEVQRLAGAPLSLCALPTAGPK